MYTSWIQSKLLITQVYFLKGAIKFTTLFCNKSTVEDVFETRSTGRESLLFLSITASAIDLNDFLFLETKTKSIFN